MNKTIIVSNRLPLQVSIDENSFEITPSVGGLATGMKSVHDDVNGIWIGWSGITENQIDEELNKRVQKRIKSEQCISVSLSQEDVEGYYEGFSNRALWPLFHYFTEYASFEESEWEAYKRVNQKFADTILNHIDDGDTIWVHDYQLLLVPKMVKDKKPNTTIGFFLHIPFPSYEIFRTIPWRESLLEGVLGADLIGFHTYDYERHFLSSIKRLLRLEVNFNEIKLEDRIIKVDSFPMGIDYDRWNEASLKRDNSFVKKSDLRKRLERVLEDNRKLILSIDRMDYTKGIPNRIKAFEYFLNAFPQYKEKVSLVMLAVPSRSNVPQYKRLKRETDELVGRINGKFASINWTPIWYFYRSVPFEDLVELYANSDVALITPIRDGMNLVAKEYVATRTQEDGVLILSEMAGAAKEMNEALLINPNSYEAFSNKLDQALSMPINEQRSRMRFLQQRLKRYDVEKWAQEFFKSLKQTKKNVAQAKTKRLTNSYQVELLTKFKNSRKPLLLLDYDGTLKGFKDNPQDAYPDEELFELLDKLQQYAKLVLISGRDRETFQKWFGHKPYTLVTDHGVWMFDNQEWIALERLKTDWMENIRPILETFVDRTPGTFIEEKKYSLAWHFRTADPELAKVRTMELNIVLTSLVSNNELSILRGNKVIEIKSSNVNKGRVVSRLLTDDNYDFITVIGDDWTDEYMFDAVPKDAYSIKVGYRNTKARFQVKDTNVVRDLLRKLT